MQHACLPFAPHARGTSQAQTTVRGIRPPSLFPPSPHAHARLSSQFIVDACPIYYHSLPCPARRHHRSSLITYALRLLLRTLVALPVLPPPTPSNLPSLPTCTRLPLSILPSLCPHWLPHTSSSSPSPPHPTTTHPSTPNDCSVTIAQLPPSQSLHYPQSIPWYPT